jgi:hypothetical protein
VRGLWSAWKRLARRIGDAQARVVLTVFYFLVLGPFAAVLRLRSDPLALRPGAAGRWQGRDEAADGSLAAARRQS